MNKIAPHHLSTLRRMLADIDPIRGHESERRKNALLAVLKAADSDATVNVVANKSIADIIAEHDPDSSFDAANMTLSVGGVIAGTLVIIAPETASEEQMLEFVKSADDARAHNGPVIILSHNWQAMSGDELRAELDRIESQPENILNKSDKAMQDLLDTRPDKLDKSDQSATLGG